MRTFLFLLLLVGCTQKPQMPSALVTYECSKMEIPLLVKTERGESVAQIIEEVFDEIDRIYNNWNPLSEISRVNQLSAYERMEISEELACFLRHVDAIVKVTQGRFDPTVDPLQKLWKRHLARKELPSPDEIDQAQAGLGWSYVHLEGREIFKEYDQTAIDLSAVAKGYAVDLLAQRLQKAGYESVFVNWGGEIKVLGKHPDQRLWKIAILGGDIVEIEDCAIATSGSYLQNWTVGNQTYTHLIDPFKKEPLRSHSISSASVILEECATADAIATALMLFSSADEAKAWFADNFPEGKAMIIETASLPDPSPASSLSR